MHGQSRCRALMMFLLNYLPKNVAPEIDDITVQPGYRYQPIPHVTGTEAGIFLWQPRFDLPSTGRCATATRSASAGRRMTTTTINSSSPSTTAATAKRAGCC